MAGSSSRHTRYIGDTTAHGERVRSADISFFPFLPPPPQDNVAAAADVLGVRREDIDLGDLSYFEGALNGSDVDPIVNAFTSAEATKLSSARGKLELRVDLIAPRCLFERILKGIYIIPAATRAVDDWDTGSALMLRWGRRARG